MKFTQIASIALFFYINIGFAEQTYLQEFKAFKETAEYKEFFDNKDVASNLKNIQRDIYNHQQLSFIYRLLHKVFLDTDTIIVNSRTMPKLYSHIENICNEQKIKVPAIFISNKKSIFNAFAAKLFLSCGGLLIGQKILNEVTDEELEAVIAHELGHIKYNHTNKMFALNRLIYIFVASWVYDRNPIRMNDSFFTKIDKFQKNDYQSNIWAALFTQLIIGKRFERQADEFAYKTVGKGRGLKQFMQRVIEKRKKYEAEITSSKALLQTHQQKFGTIDNLLFKIRFFFADELHKLYYWLYYNTRLGAHPSPEARIETIEKYLKAIDTH